MPSYRIMRSDAIFFSEMGKMGNREPSAKPSAGAGFLSRRNVGASPYPRDASNRLSRVERAMARRQG